MVPQINQTANVAGFSPAQWVLGYQPHVPGELLSDGLGPQHLDGNSSSKTTVSERCRKSRSVGCGLRHEAPSCLLRKYEGDNSVLQVGQLCFFGVMLEP